MVPARVRCTECVPCGEAGTIAYSVLARYKPRSLAEGDQTAMSPKTKKNLFRLALLPLAAILLVATGCTSSLTGATQSSATGSAFVVGTDAPMAAVTSFSVQIESITATDTTTEKNRVAA